jgi:MATE family multidrug resistance protein
MRGLGMQMLGTWVVIFSFYGVCLTSAYIFAFAGEMNLKGLWLGVICGLSVQDIIYWFILNYLVNWNKKANDIHLRMKLKGLEGTKA